MEKENVTRYLMILEVSQKQAYIFASTRLRDNIANSDAICKVTDPRYFEQLSNEGTVKFDTEKNLVYSGGGHTVLEFENEDEAKKFAYDVSKAVKREFHDIELFIKIIKYREDKTPGENLKMLSEQLEKKKSVRKASFHQGTFGVEQLDTTMRRPIEKVLNTKTTDWKPYPEAIPDGYHGIYQFGKIGNKKDESSFIAVVHVDGNAMGKRVDNLREKFKDVDWKEYKGILKNFSDSIDQDFKAAYREMIDEIAKLMKQGKLDQLDLADGDFPIRRIILAGDDVCFVTEGRIGIEAARIFIDKLTAKDRKNKQDNEGYTACAGVAIVHQKSPFYKAYEMSEMLCSNAKKYLASFQNQVPNAGGRGCAIDWHIEYGIGMDTLSETRKMYNTGDGNRLELRPYMICADDELMQQEHNRRYVDFKKRVRWLNREIKQGRLSRGKVKELRSALKEGEQISEYYLKSNLMMDLPLMEHEGKPIEVEKLFHETGLKKEIFINTADGEKRSLLFDAIEIIDTFIDLSEGV